MPLSAWRLAVGTLTAVPVRPPDRVDRATARTSALLAPLAVLPLGLAAGVVLWVGRSLHLAPLAVGVVAVAAVVAGSRALHVDGLADTADGLTASYDRERALAVMRTGDVGPAGVAAVVLALGVQAAGFAALGWGRGPVLAGVAVCLSRLAVAGVSVRGVPAARADGLGSAYAGVVPRVVLALAVVVAAVVLALVAGWAGLSNGRGVAAVLLAAVAVAALVRRAVRRLGGITGDVLGAAVELSLATLLLVLS